MAKYTLKLIMDKDSIEDVIDDLHLVAALIDEGKFRESEETFLPDVFYDLVDHSDKEDLVCG